jgi:hypothetical protein
MIKKRGRGGKGGMIYCRETEDGSGAVIIQRVRGGRGVMIREG